MVDRIRMFNSDYTGKLNAKKLKNFKPKDAEKGFKYYKLKSPKDKSEYIYLVVKVGMRNGKQFVSIDGSLRKWFFSMNNFLDLDYYDFKKTIELIGEIMCFDKDALWGFRVSIIELGFNVQLPMFLKGFIDCYGSYSTFQRHWFEGETMQFIGKSYSMIVYDKGEEIVKKRSTKRSKKSPNGIKNMIGKATWFRYEFKTDTLSKVPNVCKMANTPGKILNNWDELMDVVHGKIKDMMLIDFTLPNYIDEFVAKNKTELKNYLINIGMLTIGVGKTMSMVDKTNTDKKEVKKELRELNLTFIDKPRLDLQKELKRRISKRVRKLKGNDRVF